jgi:hypothetical protein
VTGSPPRVTLTPDKTSYTDGDPIRVAVTVSDPDTGVDVIHGADSLGRVVDETIARADTAKVTAAVWTTSGDAAAVAGMIVTGTARVGSGALRVDVQDAQGNVTTATCNVAVTAPAPTMLIGSDRPGVQVAMYPGMRYFRAYTQPGKGIQALPSARGLLYHMSFHDTPTSALLQGWFKTLPSRSVLATPKWALPFDVIIEYDHEPEGDMTAVAYRAGVDLVKAEAAAWNKAHPNGPTVAVWQTFTGYAQVHHNKSMADGVPATVDNLWRHADGLGVDMEKDTLLWPNGFTNPEAAFGWARDQAKALGVPWGVAEFGDAGPAAGLAGRYTTCLTWFGKNDCAFCGVYDTKGTTSDYTLSGEPQVAVKAEIAGQ